MANNYGLMLAAGGAALIGFVFLSMGKDEAAEASVSTRLPDLDELWEDPDKNADGTCTARDGRRVICPEIRKSDIIIQECEDVYYDEGGDGICLKEGGVPVPFPKETDPPGKRFYGMFDFFKGTPQQDDILERAEDPGDSKLYLFSGEPVIESIGITKPAWLAEQDPDPIQ